MKYSLVVALLLGAVVARPGKAAHAGATAHAHAGAAAEAAPEEATDSAPTDAKHDDSSDSESSDSSSSDSSSSDSDSDDHKKGRKGKHGHGHGKHMRGPKVTKEEMETFGTLFKTEAARYADLDFDSKLRRQWMRYMHGKDKKMEHKMHKMMFKKGGVFDKFAGEDGSMDLKEAMTYNDAVKKGFESKIGEEIIDYTDEQFKKMYDIYAAMSKGDGFTKKDARRGARIFDTIRDHMMNWKPSMETRKEFKNILKGEDERYNSLPEDSKLLAWWNEWKAGRADKDVHKMNKHFMSKGGPFDQFSGEDGAMSLDEARKMNEVITKKVGEAIGETVPAYSDDFFKQIYNAYDHLSPDVKGFTKKDTMKAQHITNWVRDHRITEREMDKFYPLGEMIYDGYEELPEDNKHHQVFERAWKEPINEKEQAMFDQAFEKFDKNSDGKLNRKEWNHMNEETQKYVNKLVGQDGPEWTDGDNDFFWTMSNSVSNGRWNKGHRRADRGGMTLRDAHRLNRILRKIYADMEEESDSDDEAEATEGSTDGADLFLL